MANFAVEEKDQPAPARLEEPEIASGAAHTRASSSSLTISASHTEKTQKSASYKVSPNPRVALRVAFEAKYG